MLDRQRGKQERYIGEQVGCARETREQRLARFDRRGAIECERERPGKCWHCRERGFPFERARDRSGRRRVARREPDDAENQLRARVAGRKRQDPLGRRTGARFVARREQRLGNRLPWREIRRIEPRRLPPRADRLGQAAQLPQDFAQHEVRIRRSGIGAARAPEAQHRVDGTPFPLMRASARDPVRALVGAHRRGSDEGARALPSAARTRVHWNGGTRSCRPEVAATAAS